MGEQPFLQRLKERKLVRWALAYLAGAFVVFQAVEVMAEPWSISPALQRTIHVLLLLGVFITLVLAWYHGEKGRQGVSLSELFLLAVLGLVGVVGVWATGEPRGAAEVGSPDLDPRTVAVLYFEDLSPNGAYQHVADGFTEGLISELSRVNGLDVISRNGVGQLRDVRAPLDSVAEVLRAGTLVHGSLEPAGEQLRVSVRLVEGISGDFFDRRTFDLPNEELLAAQDSLAEEVAWLLRRRLGGEVTLARRRAATSSVEAWGLVQRGERERKAAEDLVRKGDADAATLAFARADSFLAASEAADPEWAEPPTQRAWVAYRLSRTVSELEDVLQQIERGQAHADRALSIDPNEASALEARGTLRYWLWIQGVIPDYEEAEELLGSAQADLEGAVDIDPSRAGAHATLSHLYYTVSDLTSALLSARTAYETDVFLESAPEVLQRLFFASYDTEQFTQARWACDEGYTRFSRDHRFWECKLMELAMPSVTPDVDEAWRIQRRTVELAPEARRSYQEHRSIMLVGAVLARAELPDSARRVLLRARAGADVDPYLELPFIEAYVRTLLGDYDEAVERLRTYTAGFAGTSSGDPADWASFWWWRDLQNHRGFQELVATTIESSE